MLEIDVECRLGRFELAAKFTSDAPVTALFGRSGAGKTSLVNMIGGLLRPARGRIVIDGQVLFDSRRRVHVPAHKRGVGYIFQESRLFPHLTVRQNLLYGRWFTKPAARYIEPEQVIALLDIAPLLERRPGLLSGGEKQRVAIGRALLASPKLLLMDEPLASLDAARKSDILRYIERLNENMRVPIVYVSHSIEEVTRLAHCLVVMSDGRVAASGSLPDVTSRLDLLPLTGRYAAGAIIEARVLSHDEAFELTRLGFGGGELTTPRVAMPPGARVRVHVRARDVAIALARPTGLSIQNVLAATLVDISQEPGAFAEIKLAVGVGHTPLLARITRRAAHELKLAPGAAVFALVKAVSLDRHSLGLASTPAMHRPRSPG
ncbi:MAG: molybdenum ABC transporter ATP-binding protein [Gammaproteobacteria bacterium]